MEDKKQSKLDLEELKDLYLFDELFRFIRKSAGITISISYLVLLLSSMSYLYIVYSALNINILQFVTLEDILATPIKNPDIVLTFFLLFLIFYIADIGNRYRARMEEKYADDKKPLIAVILHWVFWGPKKRKTNIRATFIVIAFSLIIYVVAFATAEARHIQRGKGTLVEITFADDQAKLNTTLLGTTSNFIMTYDHQSGESAAYYVEAIKSIKKINENTTKAKQPAKQALNKQTPIAPSKSTTSPE